MTTAKQHGVHFVGSFPFRTADEVFTTIGRSMEGLLSRVPDGEAQGWISFVGPKVMNSPGLRQSSAFNQPRPDLRKIQLVEIEPGLSAGDVILPKIGYEEIATDSYAKFKKLRQEGKLPPDVRFQVSLPTPFAVLSNFVVPQDVKLLLPAFQRRMLEDVEAICRRIPQEDLAIQWDVCLELMVEHSELTAGFFPVDYLTDAVSQVTNQIPSKVELGLHFCYGNPGGRHIVEPDDTRSIVNFANAVLLQTRRRTQWIHLPVPSYRDDLAYYAPLQGLRRQRFDELYLGLVHLSDGTEGARRRIAAARPFLGHFGVACECGFSQYKAENITELLKLHREAAEIATKA